MSMRHPEMRYLSEAERILYFWEQKGVEHDEQYRETFINKVENGIGRS